MHVYLNSTDLVEGDVEDLRSTIEARVFLDGNSMCVLKEVDNHVTPAEEKELQFCSTF